MATLAGLCSKGHSSARPDFPEVMQNMQRDLDKVLAYCVERFPNLKIAYLTCDGFRHFTGFEPHVYQEAFALKWLIENQLRGEASTRFEGPDAQADRVRQAIETGHESTRHGTGSKCVEQRPEGGRGGL